MSRLRNRLAGVPGTTEETDLIKLPLKRASAKERSDVRNSYDQTKMLYSDGLRKLGSRWTSSTGKQGNRKNRSAVTFL
jgi:hypothetical protein